MKTRRNFSTFINSAPMNYCDSIYRCKHLSLHFDCALHFLAQKCMCIRPPPPVRIDVGPYPHHPTNSPSAFQSITTSPSIYCPPTWQHASVGRNRMSIKADHYISLADQPFV
ncbi:hypothetical protein BDZ97DRAFT_1237354 [Flammula alnicola]|nr:hypothetical protein BDZ97DRAFT_1237354 [Flammula alnicola]